MHLLINYIIFKISVLFKCSKLSQPEVHMVVYDNDCIKGL